jgi:hypothetical protein
MFSRVSAGDSSRRDVLFSLIDERQTGAMRVLSPYAFVATCERFSGDGAAKAAVLRNSLRHLKYPEGVHAVDVFSAHPDYACVPIFKDGPPPGAIVEIASVMPEELNRWLAAGTLQNVLEQCCGADVWVAGMYDIARHAVIGDEAVRERTAQTSFVVRYYPPVADARHFAEHYIACHPSILARLPRLRNVLCYVPHTESVPGFARDTVIIRNEVVFASVDDLTFALQSSVLADLRADSQAFPPFGHSTHHAMMREQVFRCAPAKCVG